MRKIKALLPVACLSALTLTAMSHAETKRPPERNAALRYWLAFAEMQDQPADKNVAELLDRTAAGESAWDEKQLGPILDRNESAILGLQRASKLPECDWGLEYEQGPDASVAYAPRARVLARLNTLYGIRTAAKGDIRAAVEAWLAGVRFSQHVAQGGSLIFALIGKTVLLSNVQVLTPTVESGKLTAEQKQQAAKVIQSLPETGFDWGTALGFEQEPLDISVRQMAASRNPRKYYEEVTGKPAPGIFQLPTNSDIAAFHGLLADAEAALRLPPTQAEDRLRALQESVKTLHPFYQATIPSFTHINSARTEIQIARERLLRALSNR
jgi:hypothetical protein